MQQKRTILFALFLVVTLASWSVAPAADGLHPCYTGPYIQRLR